MDISLTAILILQMSYMKIGELTHEVLGILMFILFTIHLYLNKEWLNNINNGKYTLFRKIQMIINILAFSCMILMAVSGVIISKHIFSFFEINKGISLGRNLHIFASYWGFIVISLHIGFHWKVVLNKIIKRMNNNKYIENILEYTGLVGFLLGIYIFKEENIIRYLFLIEKFVFFDTNINLFIFLAKYLMIMWAYIYIGYKGKEYFLQKRNKLL